MATTNLKKYLTTLSKKELINHIVEPEKKFIPVPEYYQLSEFKSTDTGWGFYDTLSDYFFQFY